MRLPTKADSDEEEEKGAFDTGDLEGWIKVSGSRCFFVINFVNWPGMDFGDLTKEDVEGSCT